MNSTSKVLLFLALGYLGFVIYGSLVPLTFRPMSLEQAIANFARIPYLNLGIGSRADWVANILLFIPLVFLWLGCFCPRRSFVGRVLISLSLWVACIGLSVAIEFTQQFFPQRTVSLNDIMAESIGTTIGVGLWWWRGPWLIDHFSRWVESRFENGLIGKLFWIYLFLFFGYNLLPLDLTINPVEIYHKWKEGRVVLLPFAFYGNWSAAVCYELITDILLWVPLAALLVASGSKTLGQSWLLITGSAVLLEFLQLFVFTRITDVTDILMASLGAAIGSWLGSKWRSTLHDSSRVGCIQPPDTLRISFIFFVGWACVLALVFWFPFDFQVNTDFIGERLQLFSRVPFYNYYYGTEFHAVTEVFHKTLFFFPLGLAFSLPFRPMQITAWRSRWIALPACAMVALVIEVGQLALPTRVPDATDLMFEILGAWAGYEIGWLLIKSQASLVGRKDL